MSPSSAGGALLAILCSDLRSVLRLPPSTCGSCQERLAAGRRRFSGSERTNKQPKTAILQKSLEKRKVFSGMLRPVNLKPKPLYADLHRSALRGYPLPVAPREIYAGRAAFCHGPRRYRTVGAFSGRRVGGAFVAAVSPKSVSGISQNTKDAHNLREGETTAPRP